MLTYHLSSYFVILLTCSLHVLISCVQIQPNFEVISIWNTDRKFVVCSRDRKESEGRVQWFGPNGRSVGVSHLSSVYQVGSGSSSKLFFVRPYKVNSGIYVCKHLKNDTLHNDQIIEVKVFDNIDMSGNTQLYKIEEGGTLVMHCAAKFDSDATETHVHWEHENNALITDLSRYKIGVKTEETVNHKVINTSMTISKVESGDAGFYRCQAIYANSYLSDIKSIDVEVIVQYKPHIEGSPRKVIWLDEQNEQDQEFSLELKCQAYADPVARFDWYIGYQNVHAQSSDSPKFIEVLTKDHMSTLNIRLKNMDKFKFYAKELRETSKNIMCRASNSHGTDSLVFDFKFGSPPRIPELLYIDFLKESKYIYLEINYTETEPPIDMFKLVLSKQYYIYFNNSHKTNEKYKDNFYKIPYDPERHIEFLDLFAHNSVGWSRPLEMQDTTPSPPGETDQTYEWKLSNFQICVLLFILFLLVASTAFQVVYFNYCDKGEQET